MRENIPKIREENEPKSHLLRNSTAVILLASSGFLIAENYETISGVTQVVQGYSNKNKMSIPNVVGCPDLVPQSELTLEPMTTISSSGDFEPNIDGNNVDQNNDSSEIEVNTDSSSSPDNIRSSARKSSITELNPLKIVDQYFDYFDHEFARYVAPESGIEFRFYQYGNEQGLKYFDPHTFSEAFHATLTIPTEPNDPAAAHAIKCMRDYFFGDGNGQGRKAEGYILPIVIPDRPACIRNGLVVYKDCDSMGYAWPNIIPLGSKYDEFLMITTGSKLDNVSARSLYINIAHEGAHKLREIAEGDNYRFALDPEEGWALYLENLIKYNVPSSVPKIFDY